MTSPISRISNLPAPEAVRPQPGAKRGEFKDALETAIDTVEGFRKDAAQAVEKLISGQGQELHSAVLATERAELAFEVGLQIRNKVVQAYQEIMRMQI